MPDSGDPLNERFLADPETRDLIQVDDVPQGDGTVQQRYSFRDTRPLAGVSAADYDVIFYAGGNAAPFQFVDDARVPGAAIDAYDAGRLVTAVCHGTSALLEAKLPGGQHLVAGRRVTGFSTAEEDALGQRAVMPVLLEEAFPLRGATTPRGAGTSTSWWTPPDHWQQPASATPSGGRSSLLRGRSRTPAGIPSIRCRSRRGTLMEYRSFCRCRPVRRFVQKTAYHRRARIHRHSNARRDETVLTAASPSDEHLHQARQWRQGVVDLRPKAREE